jgi:nucleoside-specific outer membrane channel protein Tsx
MYIKVIALFGALHFPMVCMGWAHTEIQLLHGDGFRDRGNPDGIEKNILTLLHASDLGLFKQFFFVDFFAQDGRRAAGVSKDPDAAGFYGEYYQNFSLSKLAGWKLDDAPVKGVNLTAGINYGRHDGVDYPVAKVWLYGMSFDINMPKGFLNVSLLTYDDQSYSDSGTANSYVTYQITPAWSYPFEVLDSKFEFAGYIDFIGKKGPDKVSYIGSQIQLRYDAGHLFGMDGKVFVGLEYNFFNNKFGIKGLSENVPQALLVWVF